MKNHFSIRLAVKYILTAVVDPFAAVFEISNAIKYYGETVQMSGRMYPEGEFERQVLSVTGANDIIGGRVDSYDIEIEFMVKDNCGYLLLEIFVDDRLVSPENNNLLAGRADLLCRYLFEWIQRYDALFASVHTSLEPLSFSDLDETSFPSRVGWVTYFGKEICSAVGSSILLGADSLLYRAFVPSGCSGIFWQITASITQRPGCCGEYGNLRRYMKNYLFRLLQLVETSHYSLLFSIEGSAAFTAISSDVVSDFSNILGCDLEQYKDLWGTVDGNVFGAKVHLSFEETNEDCCCDLSITDNLRFSYRSDVIAIDISDYLYTLVKVNSMNPDSSRLGFFHAKSKESLYALKARVAFCHRIKLENICRDIAAVFGCKSYDLSENMMTMLMLGTRFLVKQTHEYEALYYYVFEAVSDDAVDENWRYIDVSAYVTTVLSLGGIIGDGNVVR